jgi:epoxide hydrolase 4
MLSANDFSMMDNLMFRLGEWVPDLRVELIPGAGHWVPYEKPERINSLIREFID